MKRGKLACNESIIHPNYNITVYSMSWSVSFYKELDFTGFTELLFLNMQALETVSPSLLNMVKRVACLSSATCIH